MGSYLRVGLAAVALATWAGTVEGGGMIEDRRQIVLRPLLTPPTLPISDAKLLAGGNAVMMFFAVTRPARSGTFHETAIYTLGVEPRAVGPTEVLVISQLLPVPLQWDALLAPDGGYFVVYQMSGGAIDAVKLRIPGAPTPLALTQRYPLESFRRPRFTRRAVRDPSSVSMISDRELAVVFDVPVDSKPGRYRKVGECEDAAVVAQGRDTLLVCKASLPGPARGSVGPGELSLVKLGADSRPLGPPVKLFGGLPVFEFDVELLANGIGVLAVASGGPRMTVVFPGGGAAVEPFAFAGDFDPGALGCPSLRAVGPSLFLSVVESPGTKASRIFLAKVPGGLGK